MCTNYYQNFRFSTKESAAQAIVNTHGGEINGHTVKCSWGKESNDQSPPGSSGPVAVPASTTPVSPVGFYYAYFLHVLHSDLKLILS